MPFVAKLFKKAQIYGEMKTNGINGISGSPS